MVDLYKYVRKFLDYFSTQEPLRRTTKRTLDEVADMDFPEVRITKKTLKANQRYQFISFRHNCP